MAAALAQFLRQNRASRIRKAACKRRSRHWATECLFALSAIVSLISSSAAGAKQNGLQQEKTEGFLFVILYLYTAKCSPEGCGSGPAAAL